MHVMTFVEDLDGQLGKIPRILQATFKEAYFELGQAMFKAEEGMRSDAYFHEAPFSPKHMDVDGIRFFMSTELASRMVSENGLSLHLNKDYSGFVLRGSSDAPEDTLGYYMNKARKRHDIRQENLAIEKLMMKSIPLIQNILNNKKSTGKCRDWEESGEALYTYLTTKKSHEAGQEPQPFSPLTYKHGKMIYDTLKTEFKVTITDVEKVLVDSHSDGYIVSFRKKPRPGYDMDPEIPFT